MLKEAYEAGYAYAFEKIAKLPMPGGGMSLLERASSVAAKTPKAPGAPKVKPAPAPKPAGEPNTIDYSGWARQPTKPPAQPAPAQAPKPLSPKAQEAMKAFTYRPGA